jgi:hypothetical protein
MSEDKPELVEPSRDYLGFVCEKCGQSFSIVGPLDPTQMPPDQPMRVGSPGPLHGHCPHCQHQADYPIARLIRLSR